MIGKNDEPLKKTIHIHWIGTLISEISWKCEINPPLAIRLQWIREMDAYAAGQGRKMRDCVRWKKLLDNFFKIIII